MGDEMEFVVPDSVGRLPRAGRSTVNSSFAPKDLYDVAKKWGDEKKECVRLMGLGGLLLVDYFSHWNRDYSQFLYQCIDCAKSRLVLGNNKYAGINDSEFTRILGIREGGTKDVQHTRGSATAREIQVACGFLQIPPQHVTTYLLMDILKEPSHGVLTEKEQIRVKVAYAMLAVTVFFSPREKRGPVPRDAYMIAQVPADLDRVNWGKYVVAEVLDAAIRMQDSIRRHIAGFTIYGCQMPVQILYLDSVDMGLYAVSPNLVPRIAHYTAAAITALIRRDTFFVPTEKIYGIFRRTVNMTNLIRENKAVVAIRQVGRPPRASGAVRTKKTTAKQLVLEQSVPALDATAPQQASILDATFRFDVEPQLNDSASSYYTQEQPDGTEHSPQGDSTASFIEAVEAWLKNGVVEIEGKSKSRSIEFYKDVSYNMQLYDASVKSRVEAHEQMEKVMRLQGLQYMLQHLICRGVGEHMPSLEAQLSNINNILGANSGPVYGDPVAVLNFIGVTPLHDLPFMPRQGSGSGSRLNENENEYINLGTEKNPLVGMHDAMAQDTSNCKATNLTTPTKDLQFMGCRVSGSTPGLSRETPRLMNIPLRATTIRDEGGRMYKELAATGALHTAACPSTLYKYGNSMAGAFRTPTSLATGGGTAGLDVNHSRGTVYSPCPIRVVPMNGRISNSSDGYGMSRASGDQVQRSTHLVNGRDSVPACAGMDLNQPPSDQYMIPNTLGQHQLDRNMISKGDDSGGPQKDVRGKGIWKEGKMFVSLDNKKRSLYGNVNSLEDREIIVYTATKGKRSRSEPNYVLCDKKKVTNRVPGICPLYCNYEFDMPSAEDANYMYENMVFGDQQDMQKFWVVHTKPKLLKITGNELLDSFTSQAYMQGKVFEAVRRMLKDVEHTWYSWDDKSRFRHYMPNEWASSVLSGDGYLLDLAIKDMFTGPCIGFDVETSHMIWVPHVESSSGIFVLYGFDMNLDIVHVMDPKRTCAGRKVLESIHESVCCKLLQGLVACIEAFFDGWEIEKGSWTFLYHEFQNAPCSDEDTVLYTIHNMMYFDGIAVTEQLTKECLVNMRNKLMVMVINMPGNIGHVPLAVKKPVG